LYTEDVYSATRPSVGSVQLKVTNVKLATRTNIELQKNKYKLATTYIFLGMFRPNQDVNIEKVKGEGKSKLSAYTQNNAHQTAKSTWSQKSRDPPKGGTEGHGKANCL